MRAFPAAGTAAHSRPPSPCFPLAAARADRILFLIFFHRRVRTPNALTPNGNARILPPNPRNDLFTHVGIFVSFSIERISMNLAEINFEFRLSGRLKDSSSLQPVSRLHRVSQDVISKLSRMRRSTRAGRLLGQSAVHFGMACSACLVY